LLFNAELGDPPNKFWFVVTFDVLNHATNVSGNVPSAVMPDAFLKYPLLEILLAPDTFPVVVPTVPVNVKSFVDSTSTAFPLASSSA